MDLWYLKFLVSGQIPNHTNWSKLNAKRQAVVEKFVQGIPQKYSVEEIQNDINRISSNENNVVFKFVANFRLIAVITSALFFILYWIVFGFWTGLLSGVAILVCCYYLDNRLAPLIDLSGDSTRLITDFDALLNRLGEAQKKENEIKKGTE